jgi:uncharacterized protein (DUF849 family)
MNVKQIFPSPWLSPDDIGDRRVEVVIAGAAFVEVHNRRTNSKEQRLAISFHKATKRMIVNKTQSLRIAEITGEFDTDNWPGHRIALRVGRAPNGKPTIVVERASVPAPGEQSSEAGEHPAA